MTEMVTYTHSSEAGDSIVFRTKDVTFNWESPGKGVEPKHKATGTAGVMNDSVVVDPNKGFRTISVTMKDLQGYHATADCLNNINNYLLPASKPTYSASYPMLRVYLDGTNYWDIKIMMLNAKAIHVRDNLWAVTVNFLERTA